MGEEVFDELLGNFEGVGVQTPDGRRVGYNQNYEIQDGINRIASVMQGNGGLGITEKSTHS
jgi:hypothetical protein